MQLEAPPGPTDLIGSGGPPSMNRAARHRTRTECKHALAFCVLFGPATAERMRRMGRGDHESGVARSGRVGLPVVSVRGKRVLLGSNVGPCVAGASPRCGARLLGRRLEGSAWSPARVGRALSFSLFCPYVPGLGSRPALMACAPVWHAYLPRRGWS
jgi:hypothetical protein